jgi:phosphoribosylformylglycinamidine synthase subunit PurQ / glutaminase
MEIHAFKPMTKPKALVLSGNGLNCENETMHALRFTGADAYQAHLYDVYNKNVKLSDYSLLVFIGGFESGDEGGSAVMWAHRLKKHLAPELQSYVQDGRLMLGICNGFQALAKTGLLPGLNGNYTNRVVSVIYNDCGNFRDQWVTLEADVKSPCVFTKGIEYIDLPVRHGEGKVVFKDQSVLEKIIAGNLAPLTYCMWQGTEPADKKFPHNPNGSEYDIAGICDPTGRIFGLMPHPEAYNHPTNHPLWTRHKSEGRELKADGLKIFENAVKYLEKL